MEWNWSKGKNISYEITGLIYISTGLQI